MPLTLLTGPASEPITLKEAKAHLRVDFPDDNDLISSLITAARQRVENYLSRKLFTQSWRYSCDSFPAMFMLPVSPIQSITQITYLDTAGASQTVSASDYVVDVASLPPRVALAEGAQWPQTQAVINAVQVDFVAGYSAIADIPETIKQAILVTIGTMYENRETLAPIQIYKVPDLVETLLQSERMWTA